MNDNIKEFVELIEATAKNESGNPYAYCAGYYESLIRHLAKDIPEVAEYIQRRVNFIKAQNAAKAAA